MWYVIQVRTGSEDNIRLQCEKNISTNILKDCFIPYYEERKHLKGEWRTLKKILFPGYVFLDSEEWERLFMNLKQVSGLTKLLGIGDDVVPLTEEEVEFLTSFGGEDQVVPISEGIIENSKVIVMSGPLTGKEGYIKKIDRHKRKAYLELPMFGRIQRIQVGLEIVSKEIPPAGLKTCSFIDKIRLLQQTKESSRTNFTDVQEDILSNYKFN